MKRIGVLTSGGDAPGMNAAIRGVTRAGLYNQIEVYGIFRGYQGLVEGDIKELATVDMSGIIHKGGTILKTARSNDFRTPEGRKRAYDQLLDHQLDALVVIGGDGTFTGARLFCEEYDFPVIGIPGTIDNDLYGTDYTIGYDTALNTVVEAVDKIRDTAEAHDRLFFVEVMGRDAGFIALRAGIAVGAEAIFLPEGGLSPKDLKKHLDTGRKRNKASNIILVAEGTVPGGAFEIARTVKDDFMDYDMRVTVLGHIQRGGNPSAFDRVTASRLGVAAVDALLDDQQSIMVGIVNNNISQIALNKAIKNKKKLNPSILSITDILSI